MTDSRGTFLLHSGVFLYILVIARRAVDELDESDRLPSNESDTRSRSSTIDGPSGHDGIPEGRTSMAEYRPLSAGVSGHRPAFLRPSIESSPPSLRHGVFVDGRKSMSMLGDNGGEGHGMVHQRSGFERQDSNMPLNNGNRRGYSVDLPPAYHANGHSMELEKKGVSETRVEWADANAEGTDGETAGLLDGGAGR